MKIKANHQLRVLLAILLISLAVMSCATSNKIVERDISAETSNVGLPSDVPVNVSLIEDKDPEIDLGMSLDPEAEAEIDIVDDAEFCKDNIYAKYLRDQYLQNNKKAQRPESAYKPSKKNHRRRVATRSPYDAREVEALYYARSRLLGDTVPYFGAIPVVTNPRVEHWVRFFKNNGRNSFLKWLVRGESVKNVVLPLLKSEGMPPEFIFLSMVESGFSNSAYSRARATGPWQFMPGTAKLYGLQMNMWVDERRDPAKSTQAAARLLRDLYQEFGDWYLAMAAYNAGPGRIRSAIRRTGSRDFWVLADSAYLPAETKNYVPKVLAALMLANNPQGHGFDVIGDPLDVLPTHQIEIRQPVAVSQISEKLQIPERLLRHWNPEIVNAITPPGKRGSPYLLRIKAELNDQWNRIEDSLAYLEIKDVFSHKIRKGDTLASIAARYRIG
ncbi:MAG: transglycosylase SLT domain-containing protein, partial [Proteobacteria bacterium]|nr:transglycosylase SLT domain-containing protein [Pseudomonadota bacterium]